jgi:hypothetical protein
MLPGGPTVRPQLLLYLEQHSAIAACKTDGLRRCVGPVSFARIGRHPRPCHIGCVDTYIIVRDDRGGYTVQVRYRAGGTSSSRSFSTEADARSWIEAQAGRNAAARAPLKDT